MTLSIKRRTTLHTPEAKDIELYHGASTVRDKTGQSAPETDAFLNTLEDYINGAIIQHHRIRGDHAASYRFMLESHPSPLEAESLERCSQSLELCFLHQHLTFLDIHFYAICLDKVAKLYDRVLKSLAPVAKGADNVDQVRLARRRTQTRFKRALESVGEARNYLEHIDKEISRYNFAGLSYQSDDVGMRFSVGIQNRRVTLDISKLCHVTDAYEALIEYIRALPDVQ